MPMDRRALAERIGNGDLDLIRSMESQSWPKMRPIEAGGLRASIRSGMASACESAAKARLTGPGSRTEPTPTAPPPARNERRVKKVIEKLQTGSRSGQPRSNRVMGGFSPAHQQRLPVVQRLFGRAAEEASDFLVRQLPILIGIDELEDPSMEGLDFFQGDASIPIRIH
jgi:hypothetical protein